jgi:hypothetical protein
LLNEVHLISIELLSERKEYWCIERLNYLIDMRKELESVDKGFSIKRVLEVSQDIPNSQNVILTYRT